MRIAVLSDVHSNNHALAAVIKDIELAAVDVVWCLGDVFGYGPNPYCCWEALNLRIPPDMGQWVAGNHDWGLVGKQNAVYVSIGSQGQGAIVGDFNAAAWQIITQQRKVLRDAPDLMAAVGNLPLLASPLPGVYLAHGTIHPIPEQTIGHYSFYSEDASSAVWHLRAMLADRKHSGWEMLPHVGVAGWHPVQLVFVGHTHQVCCRQLDSVAGEKGEFSRWISHAHLLESETVCLDHLTDHPVFANPGSVGFASDVMGRAAYFLLDWAPNQIKLALRRLSYDVNATRCEMKAIGTPDAIIRKLG